MLERILQIIKELPSLGKCLQGKGIWHVYVEEVVVNLREL